MNPTARERGKISRVTFNAALKPLVSIFTTSSTEESFLALSAYLTAIIDGGKGLKISEQITKPQVFRAVMALFVEVAQKVQDRHGKDYSVSNFSEAMKPMFGRLKKSLWDNTSSYLALHEQMVHALKTSFTL